MFSFPLYLKYKAEPLTGLNYLFVFGQSIAARLMHKYKAEACTDVTGFGVLGHARNLAAIQLAAVTLEIDRLPCLAGVYHLSKALAARHHLDTALTPETSGRDGDNSLAN